MKILYFHQHYSTPDGAGGIRSYAMAQKLLQCGHSVTIVCGSFIGGNTGLTGSFSKGVRRGIAHGIDVIEFDLTYSNHDDFFKRGLTFLKFAWRSVKIALSEKYDIVFASTTPLTASIPGIAARWIRSKKFIFEVRDLWPELPRAMGVIKNPVVLWSMGVLELVSYKSAHLLIGLSPGIVDGIKHRGIAPNKIKMIPNGCDIDIFAASTENWRPKGVSDTDLMAVFAGTHGIANGLDALLDAAVELKLRGREDIKLVLIGSGKQKAALQARATSEGLFNVIFHDPVNKTKLAGLMAATDLGLQVLANVPAFYYGTSPNKFFDYISAGLPVLNNYPGWLADLITQHQCGFVVKPNSSTAFADALEKAASDRHALQKMGKNAILLAQIQFSREKLAEQWVDWVTTGKINA